MAVLVAAVASIAVGLAVPATSAYASSVPAPTLVSPASSSTTPLKDVVLQWNAVPGASQYQVQVSPNDEWTNNAVSLPEGGVTVNTLYEVPVSLPHASYFWHVRAQVGGVWGAYSAPRQFLRAWPGTLAILKMPTSADPTIEWAPLSDASLYEVTFQDTSQTPNTVLHCFTEQTSFTPYVTVPSPTADNITPKPAPIAEDLEGSCFGETNLVKDDVYIWGIEAVDDSDAPPVTAEDTSGDPLACLTVVPECGGYVGDTYVSPTPFTFEEPTPAPGTFNATTSTATGLTTTWHSSASVSGNPCDTATLCPVTPTFSWNPTPGANLYRVDVYLDPLHTNDYRTYDVAWPELTPRDFYLDAQAGAWYYWTVQPMLCHSACSAPPTTLTCAAGAAGSGAAAITDIAPTPADGGNDIPAGSAATITLSESAAEIPSCVSASGGTVTKIDNRANGTIQFEYQAPPDSGSVTFLILNGDGTTSAEAGPLTINESNVVERGVSSVPNTFGKTSGAVSLVSPVNGSTQHGGSVTFTWSDYLTTGGRTALEAKNYEIQVSQDPGFDTTVIDVKDVDLAQYTNPDNFLASGTYYWRVLAIDESGKQLRWSPTYHFTVDAVSPTVSFLSTDGTGINKPLMIGTNERITGINSRTLKVVPQGLSAAHAVPGTISKGINAQTYTFTPTKPLGTGVTYVLVPTASLVDNTGNPVVVRGAGVRTALVAKATSKGWTYSNGWRKAASSSSFSGYIFYAPAGRRASVEVGGSQVALIGCLGPDFGKITISVGGHSETISEHQKFTQCGQELWHRALPTTQRKLTVSVVSGLGNIDAVEVA